MTKRGHNEDDSEHEKRVGHQQCIVDEYCDHFHDTKAQMREHEHIVNLLGSSLLAFVVIAGRSHRDYHGKERSEVKQEAAEDDLEAICHREYV